MEFLLQNKFVQIAVIICTPILFGSMTSLWVKAAKHEVEIREDQIRIENLEKDVRESLGRIDRDFITLQEAIKTTNAVIDAVREGFHRMEVNLAQIQTTQTTTLKAIEELKDRERREDGYYMKKERR